MPPINSKITLKELKDSLKKFGSKVSGRKKELIERLEFYQRNAIGDEPQNDAEFSMLLPDYGNYKDVHKGMVDTLPKIVMSRIEEYLYLFQKGFENKCKDIYEERYIRYVRICQDSDSTFVTASVWAEMRKNASYRVDITVQPTGVIHEAQCECGAGQGPTAHCKHVASVLYGLSCFKESGEIITEQTCTQILQTFHRANPYKFSPMQCNKLKELRKQANVDYDPRPTHLRGLAVQGKMDRIKNLIINQQSVRQMAPMPFMQLFPPANPAALTYDHDYCKGYDTDIFLEKQKITSIEIEDIREIESLTRNQATCKRWKKEHEIRITASKFGTICKAKTADMDKMARSLIVRKDFTSAATSHGQKYESVAIEKFEETTNIVTRKCGLFIDKTHPFIAASPDAIIDDDTLVEVKCPFTAKTMDINEHTVKYLIKNGSELSLDPTHGYHYQIQGQLMCTGSSMCYLVVFSLRDMKVIKVSRNDQFIEDMKTKLVSFFHSHFKPALIRRHYYKDYHKYCFEE